MPFLAALQFSREDSTQWVVLLVGVLATLYLLMRGRMKKNADPLERQPAMSVSQQRQIERDISNLMVEMLETARHMTAQLDTRAVRLEVLIKEADQRVASLKAATAQELPEVPVARDAQPPTPAAESQPVEKPETPPDPRHAEVYALADQGRTPHEIARHLNRPNGEVELILALRPH